MRRRLAAPVLLALAGCQPSSAAREELVVSAASSLRDALAELAPMAEARLGARLVLNFGSSGDLARQILAADGPDLFLSADEVEMERLAAAGRIEPASRRVLCANELVVIEPADEGPSPFQGPFEPSQLADVPLLSLADPLTVPAGRYARAWLEARGAWAAVAERVVPAIDARAALAAVESGALRAGIVYRTDAARSSRVRVVFRVPRAEGPRIRYPVAVVAGSPEAERARALAEFLVTEEARALLARHGFVPLGDGE